MSGSSFYKTPREHDNTASPLAPRRWVALVVALLAVVALGCYNNNTGDAHIGDVVKFKLPAFPETGSNAIQVFTEMHYQPSYRIQEVPRLLPPPDSVPVTGKELQPTTMAEYTALAIPGIAKQRYDEPEARELFSVNCAVCHGQTLRGDGPILAFWPKNANTGAFINPPPDLTSEVTKSSTDGELFGFLTGGGRQGLALRLRGIEPTSPMPEFGRLLTEEERWAIVQYLRSRIGAP